MPTRIPMEHPRQLVHAAFNALKARDYNGLASLCDRLSLASFKQEMVDQYCPAVSIAHDPFPRSVDLHGSSGSVCHLDVRKLGRTLREQNAAKTVGNQLGVEA